jgi:hypothetical protein
MVAAGEHAGAGGRAQRRDVEAAVAQPARGERVDCRRVDVAAEAPQLREAEVVEDDDDDVRRARRRPRQRIERRPRLGRGASDGGASWRDAGHGG